MDTHTAHQLFDRLDAELRRRGASWTVGGGIEKARRFFIEVWTGEELPRPWFVGHGKIHRLFPYCPTARRFFVHVLGTDSPDEDLTLELETALRD